MLHGFVCLVAIMDCYSRSVLAWEISTTLDTGFCVSTLEKALTVSTPEIFNTDQGSQFTSREFTGLLEKEDIRISMDGRGRAMDNVFIERLWRTVKYEEIYLKDYDSAWEVQDSLTEYFHYYCDERIHQSLGYRTPAEVYYQANLS